MFNIKNITYDASTQLYRCTCQCGTEAEAEGIAAGYFLPLREAVGFTTELTHQGNTAILTSPDQETLVTAAKLLNNSIYR